MTWVPLLTCRAACETHNGEVAGLWGLQRWKEECVKEPQYGQPGPKTPGPLCVFPMCALNMSTHVWARMCPVRKVGRHVPRKGEKKLRKPNGDMDIDLSHQPHTRPRRLPDVSLS